MQISKAAIALIRAAIVLLISASVLWFYERIAGAGFVSKGRSSNQTLLGEFRKRHRTDNLLILVFDAASADHLSCYGYPQKTTPGIDAIARKSVLWENAFSSASFTTPSTASLFTGLYPDANGVLEETDILPNQYKTLAEYFSEAGYKTALFSGNPNASQVRGFGQGFQTIWTRFNIYVTNASEVVPAVNSWLDQVQNSPFFGYIHFREPHLPYSPPPEFLQRFGAPAVVPEYDPMKIPQEHVRVQVISSYDANLAFVDNQFQRIIRKLESLGILDRTILFLLADHGEAFWQHGIQGHQWQVYDEMIHIPLITYFPGERFMQGIRNSQLTGNIDIMPTLLDLYGFPTDSGILNGRSMLPLLFGNTNPRRMILSRSSEPNPSYSLKSLDFQYIRHSADRPQERDPRLSVSYSMQMDRMLQELRASRLEIPDRDRQTQELKEEVKEQLRALGYAQ